MKKVLIVDDSKTMRLFIKMALRHLQGLDISEAEDGLDAVGKIEKEGFDLIITDVHMPRLDGLDLIRKLRNVMGLRVPIIILTTDGDRADIRRGLELGADGYATKPIMGPALADLVSNHIRLAEGVATTA